MLKDIITSEARLKVLKFFYIGGEIFSPYVREIVRGTDLEINAVRRELIRLSKAKLLLEDPRGNRLHYYLNPKHTLYYDLASVFAKEIGLGRLIHRKKKRIGNITFCLLSLNFFLKRKVKNPIDMIMVGDLYLSFLKELIIDYQKEHKEEVNYMVLTDQEYRILKDRKDQLIMNAICQPRAVIIGSQEKYLNP